MIIISILGSGLVYAGTSTAARYAGLLLMGIYSATMPVSLAMISSNVGGFTKKTTVSAIYFIMYCTGNIIGPQLFFTREAPKYQVSSPTATNGDISLPKLGTDISLERFPGNNNLPRYLRRGWTCLIILSALGEFPARQNESECRAFRPSGERWRNDSNGFSGHD
jgi:hypothetical protein